MNDREERTKSHMARAAAARGDTFPELALVAELAPHGSEVMLRLAGYVHAYEGFTAVDQELSHPVRVLIVFCVLCSKGEHRLTPNYVRRLYRMGITDAAMLDAAHAMAPFLGYLLVASVALAIATANSPEYPYGAMPPGGRPQELVTVPEFSVGGSGDMPGSVLDASELATIEAIDPGLLQRAKAFLDYCNSSDRGELTVLGSGLRETLAVVALCFLRDPVGAGQHIKRALACGFSRRRITEAVACIIPTIGPVVLLTLARAFQYADASQP
ncbi:MAG TPA: hypothetical protein VLK85_30835 [Ramlibacter sp.]|nr:hypothetical protein [Ramlibacter sp.]